MATTEKQFKEAPFKIFARLWNCYHFAKAGNVDLGFDKAEFEKIVDHPDYFLLDDLMPAEALTDADKTQILLGFWQAYSYATRFNRFYLGFDLLAFEAILPHPSGLLALDEIPNSSRFRTRCTCLTEEPRPATGQSRSYSHMLGTDGVWHTSLCPQYCK